ncbi:hypothetical protein ACIPEN_03025 [Herbaspirillum chlorophenolicum]|uniref:Uncharacterized protein n=1 Tax=Herbaspirillum chlorophenolicum TaxID=211589 RepID=A0ABW8EVD1_9BURK
MISEKEVDIQTYMASLSERGVKYNDGVAYIMPESSSDGLDLLSEHSPDLRKDFKEYGIDSVVVKAAQYKYLALRSADIILPLIFGIPFAIFANFATDWIRKNVSGNKTVRLKFIKEDEGKYKEIVVEGTGDDVKKILDSLKDH